MDKRTKQLGMPLGTASNRLRKLLLFTLAQRQQLNVCHRCQQPIVTVDDLSIEHKQPWLDSDTPRELFFDISNIAFSHLKCNIATARKPTKHISDEARILARRASNAASMRRHYSSDKRRLKKQLTGY